MMRLRLSLNATPALRSRLPRRAVTPVTEIAQRITLTVTSRAGVFDGCCIHDVSEATAPLFGSAVDHCFQSTQLPGAGKEFRMPTSEVIERRTWACNTHLATLAQRAAVLTHLVVHLDIMDFCRFNARPFSRAMPLTKGAPIGTRRAPSPGKNRRVQMTNACIPAAQKGALRSPRACAPIMTARG
jgi:hypothetical protein